jgi:HAD superfamily hydrolase (TIGR01509 family)
MKTLILDFGNVVAFFDHRRASRQLASLAKNTITESSVYQAVFGTSLEATFDCGKISAREFIERLRIDLGLELPEDAIVKAWCDIFWPNDEVISLLPRLKKSSAKLLLASNTNELHFQWVLGQFAEPLANFEDFVLSYRIGSRKPEPAFFQRCVETARTAPDDCVYVDDRSDFVDVARAMGMAGLVYGAGGSLLKQLSAAGVKVE